MRRLSKKGRLLGRKPSISAVKIKTVCAVLAAGGTWMQAGASIQSTTETMNHWLDYGREDEQAGVNSLYAKFLVGITRAKEQGEAALVRTVQVAATEGATEVMEVIKPTGEKETRTKHIPPDGSLALKVLERRLPADWALRRQLELSGDPARPLHTRNEEVDGQVDLSKLTDEEIMTLQRIQEKLRS